MADAALALLDALDADQRAVAAWPFDDEERTRWFYTPTDHGGLPLSAMHPAQQRLTLRLVASGLSHPGYVTVATIIGLDNVLDSVEGWTATFDRERGRDPGLYYVRVFGDPGASGPWSWRFGGHHVSIQHTVLDGEVVGSTPCFLGADPASSPLLGPHPLRPLAGVEDLGRELARSLDEKQRAEAVLSPVAPTDLASANRPRFGQDDGDLPRPLPDIWRERFTGELGQRMQATQERAEREAGLRPEHLAAVRLTSVSKGVPATVLRADQRDLLRALLDLYVERIPDALADGERAKYADDDGLDELAFAWAGSMEPGHGHYYRVQGRKMLVEYDNTQRGANHVHSVWRDIGGDFGFDPLAEHLRRDH
jgi:hypothetical protein